MLLMPLVFGVKRNSREKVDDFASSEPDVTSIENLWAIVMEKIYVGGRQHMRLIKADLWDASWLMCKNANSKDIESPTNSLE